MAKRTTRSKTRTTLIGTAITVVCAVAVPWGPGCLGCELDTSPIKPRHVVRPTDDNDSGDNEQ